MYVLNTYVFMHNELGCEQINNICALKYWLTCARKCYGKYIIQYIYSFSLRNKKINGIKYFVIAENHMAISHIF